MDTSKILEKKEVVATGLVAFAAGLVVGYFLIPKKKTQLAEVYAIKEYVDDFRVGDDEEIVEVRQHPPTPGIIISADQHEAMKRNELLLQTPMKTVRTNYAAITNPQIKDDDDEDNPVISTETVEEHLERVERVTVFASGTEAWDYEKELKNRRPDAPYIIHTDEFFEAKDGYSQVQLTWYEQDGVLVGTVDGEVLYNPTNIVGPLRKEIFGHGSGDPNVLYIRNERRKAEYEIFLDPGSYERERQGLEEDPDEKFLNHSRIPKFRPE